MKYHNFLCFICLLIGINFGSSEASTERAVICENCSYSDAKELAKLTAWPQLFCHINDGSDFINVDNQSCFSDPEKIVIYNSSTRTSYPFEVYHSTQGVNPHEMMVEVRDRTVAPEIVQLLNVGVDMQQQLNNSVDQLSASLISSFFGVMQSHHQMHRISLSDNIISNYSTSNCQDDRDATALAKTYDTQAINSAQQYVQELHRTQTTSILNQFQSYFDRNTARLSTVSFGLSKGGAQGQFTVNADFVITPKTSHFTVLYNTSDDLRFFSSKGVSGWSGYPQLVFDVGPNQQGDVLVRLNENYTYIAGYSLADFRNFTVSSSPLQVSPCVLSVIQQNQPQMTFEFAGGGGDIGDIGGGIGSQPGGGVTGSLCERTVIGKVNGVIVLVLSTLVPC